MSSPLRRPTVLHPQEPLSQRVMKMRILKRPLSKKEKKKLIEEVKKYGWLDIDIDDKVEEAKVRIEEKGKEYLVYYVNGKPALWRVGEDLVPVLCGQPLNGPAVVVDEGAVKFIVKGADVMRPGIVAFEGDFKKGDIILVKSVKLDFPIAVGRALYDKEEMEKMERGKVVKNLHHLGDTLFSLCKR